MLSPRLLTSSAVSASPPIYSREPLNFLILADESLTPQHAWFDVTTYLKQNQHDIHWFTMQQLLPALGLTDSNLYFKYYQTLNHALKKIKQLLFSLNIQVLYILNYHRLSYWFAYIAKNLSLNIIIIAYFTPRYIGLTQRLKQRLYYKIMPNIQVPDILVEHTAQNELTYLTLKHLDVFYPGIDIKPLSQLEYLKKNQQFLRLNWSATSQTTVILFEGYLHQIMSIEYMIKAFRALQIAQPLRELKLVILLHSSVNTSAIDKNLIHDNIYYETKLNLIKRQALDIIIVEQSAQLDYAQYYQSANLYCRAYIDFNDNPALYRALAHALPIFIFNLNPAQAHLFISSQNHLDINIGWYLIDQAKTPVGLNQPDYVIETLKHLPRLNQLQAMGSLAYQYAQQFDYRLAGLKLEQVCYRQLNHKTQPRIHSGLLSNEV